MCALKLRMLPGDAQEAERIDEAMAAKDAEMETVACQREMGRLTTWRSPGWAGFVLAKRKFSSAHASQAARMAPATRGTKPLPPLWTAAGGRGVHEHVRKVASHMLRTPSATRFVDGCTLDTARPEGPGAATLHGVFMGFSRGFLGVFTRFLLGFHGVSRGVTKCYEFIHKMTLLGGPRGPQGHRPV